MSLLCEMVGLLRSCAVSQPATPGEFEHSRAMRTSFFSLGIQVALEASFDSSSLLPPLKDELIWLVYPCLQLVLRAFSSCFRCLSGSHLRLPDSACQRVSS